VWDEVQADGESWVESAESKRDAGGDADKAQGCRGGDAGDAEWA
jgi:hypothetical protein